ncbi:EF-P 5-aminopentanol modification-associated protein YfmF [Longirhabdus pacifica]|uniref:EF-P 5-aminopentanol modification-associated protein YfmF n=1 Tax=Longirhabdus pacifica TaxID=2305227 RepID=UPI001008B34B|nr:pitrilysin family protein [Longirhabdus pacifica]
MSAGFERREYNNMRIHVKPTTQFKTYTMTALLAVPLCEQEVTKTALIPHVLRRGTKRFPQTDQLRKHLDHLYGTGFAFDVFKRGNYQVMQIKLDTIHEAFIQENQNNMLEASFRFLSELITEPYTEQGVFKQEYVDTEKLTLQKKLQAVVNNKTRYAEQRCLEEMCKDEPYRFTALGKLEDLDHIDPHNLYEAYRQLIETCSIDIYVVGDTTTDKVTSLAKQYLTMDRAEINTPFHAHPYVKNRNKEQMIVDQLEVTQGKLNIGLHVPVTYADKDYPALLMYNGVLGSYPHSKLFVNVREKESLAYYASSKLDGIKGIITIQSGIEIHKVDQVINIMKQQLELMRNGEISSNELEQTKAMIRNQINELDDAAFSSISYDYNQIIAGKERNKHQLIEQLEGIEAEHIQHVAKKVELDTIYFLRDKESDNV